MNGTSKRFYGTWPDGRRTIKVEKVLPVSRVTKKPIAKPLVRGLSNVGNAPLRDSLDEGGTDAPVD